MKNTRWQAWETIGLLWTLAAGNLLHFVYQWTGESTVAGLLVLLGIWAVFLLFTFRPPELAIFIDPVTGTRGIG